MLSERNKFRMILRPHGKRSTIHFLPREILFHILILLPAETLYSVVRYVCRQWYAIIQDPEFLSAHLSLSTTTLLRRTGCWDRGDWVNNYRLLDVKDSCAKLTQFKFVLRDPDDMMVYSTCNGLVLLTNTLQKTFYVGNPITRKLLALPKLYSSTKAYWYSLAVSASSRLYKLVLAYYGERFCSKSLCAILTVGVDEAWRVLDFTYLNLRHNIFVNVDLVVISGFIYWIPVYEKGIIYAFDVDFEIVNRIALPYHDTAVLYHDTGKKLLLRKGNTISLLIYYPDFSMEVWVLKDTRSEEWVKFGNIEGEPTRNEWVNIMSHYKISGMQEFYCYVRPIIWLGNGEKILFDVTSSQDRGDFKTKFFVYDFNTHACSDFDRKCNVGCEFVPFMNTLAWV